MGQHFGSVTVRPAQREDIEAMDLDLPYRVRAMVGERDDGQIIGFGGIAFPPNQPPIAFLDLHDGWHHPVSLVRAIRRLFRSLDFPQMLATIDENSPRNIRFAEAFGFTFTGAMVGDRRIYSWQRPDHVYPSKT